MERLQEILQLITKMKWSDYLDIIIVAYLLYKVLPLIRTTGTARVAKAIVAIIVIAGLTDILNLTVIFVLLFSCLTAVTNQVRMTTQCWIILQSEKFHSLLLLQKLIN
jgi:DNA integrity scanning protein DisA with diadenylate cyclase activity